jgi:predicted Holliday junction resolvase-like endonuclease
LPTNDSSRTGFVVMGSVFAIVLMVAVLIIVGLRFQVANVKAQLEEKPAGIQTRWHTRFADRFQAQRE